MAEKEQILKEEVTHTGLFDFSDFYAFAFNYFKEKQYDMSEEKYSEKVSGASKDIDAEWKCSRKISDYFRGEAKIKIEVRGSTEVEATVDGEKRKMHKGKIKLEIIGVLIRDPESKWESTPSLRFFRDVYNKFIIPAKIDAVSNTVRGELISFKEELKALFEMLGRR